MGNVYIAPYESSLEAVLVERQRFEQLRQPDIEMGDFCVLRSGQRTHKVAVHWVIRSRNTGEIKHHAIKIETYQRLKGQGGWYLQREHIVTLMDEHEDEVGKLATFLGAVRGVEVPVETQHYLIVPATGDRVNDEALQTLLENVSSTGKVGVVADVLASVQNDPDALAALVEQARSNPVTATQAAAALNVAAYTAALDTLRALVEANTAEREYQKHLAKNPWMFGSEYSELLDERHFTYKEQQDFMLRRTVDGYIEAIEIKTTLGGEPLFVYDRSHECYYQQAKLSQVVGQVMHYLEELDAEREGILRRTREDTNKIRAKVIIGRDGDEKQQEALRRLNGHLHRIEVLTFDQLIRIAEAVVQSLESILTPVPGLETPNRRDRSASRGTLPPAP